MASSIQKNVKDKISPPDFQLATSWSTFQSTQNNYLKIYGGSKVYVICTSHFERNQKGFESNHASSFWRLPIRKGIYIIIW